MPVREWTSWSRKMKGRSKEMWVDTIKRIWGIRANSKQRRVPIRLAWKSKIYERQSNTLAYILSLRQDRWISLSCSIVSHLIVTVSPLLLANHVTSFVSSIQNKNARTDSLFASKKVKLFWNSSPVERRYLSQQEESQQVGDIYVFIQERRVLEWNCLNLYLLVVDKGHRHADAA